MTNIVINNVPAGAVDIKVRRNLLDSTVYSLNTVTPGSYVLLGQLNDIIQIAADFDDGEPLVWSDQKLLPPVTPPGVTISLRAEKTTKEAPYGLYLDAVPTGFTAEAPATEDEFDPTYSDIVYVWSVEKVGDANWQTSTYKHLRSLPAANQVKGTKYGQRIYHCFGREDITGTSDTFRFTVTALEVDTGFMATSEISYEVTVTSAESSWSADEVYIVSPSGDTTDAPATNNAIFTTIPSVLSKISLDSSNNPNWTGRASVWLENDYVYDEFGDVFGPFLDISYYTWGGGARAKLDTTQGTGSSTDGLILNRFNTTVCGLDIRCQDGGIVVDGTGFHVVDDIHFIRGNSFQQQFGGRENWKLGITNSMINDWRQNVTAGARDFRDYAFVGNRIVHTEDIRTGNTSGGGYGIRPMDGKHQVILSQNEWSNKQGWFVNVAGIDTTQDIWRLFYGTNTYSGTRVLAERNYIEGEINIGTGDLGVVNVVFERNVHVGYHDVGIFIWGVGQATIRDSHFVSTSTEPAQQDFSNSVFVTRKFLSSGDLLTAAANGRAPRIYNNTFINQQYVDGDCVLYEKRDAGYPDPELSNNVLYAPNALPAVVNNQFNRAYNAPMWYPGYNDRPAAQLPKDPIYECGVAGGTLVGTFVQGDLVRGQTSGTVKEFIADVDGFRGDYYTFIGEVVNSSFPTANLDRFERDETIEVIDGNGDPTGASIVTGGLGLNQAHDRGDYMVGLIDGTIPAADAVSYTGAGGFEIGETLSGDTATGKIVGIIGQRLYIQSLSGPIADGESLSTPGGGAGTADGPSERSGDNDLWLPTTNNQSVGRFSPLDLVGQTRNSGNAIAGALVTLPS